MYFYYFVDLGVGRYALAGTSKSRHGALIAVAIGQFFSQRFGYGMHALAYIAAKPAGELTTLPELAKWLQSIWPSASSAYLSNVVQRMAQAKLLRSHRGIAGGYSLRRPATQITVRDVVEALEGIDADRCSLSLEDSCPAVGHCGIQQTLTRLERAYLDSLAAVTMADLANQAGILPRGAADKGKATKPKKPTRKRAVAN